MEKNHEIIIDDGKCIGCGLCNKDCVSGAIEVIDGKAKVNGSGCIFCGHCEAVCPQNAVKITGFTDEAVEFTEQTRLDPDYLLGAIKTRRTVRQFKDQKIPQEMVDKIIEAGRLAPTGANSQNTSFYVLDSRKDELEGIAVSMFRKLTGPLKAMTAFLSRINIDDNFFFKKAPLVIVLTGNSVNASLAAQNIAFMAEALGLGVLFSGFFTMCVNHNRKLRKMMSIGKKEKAVTTIVIGYPAVKYYRTARREDAKVIRL